MKLNLEEWEVGMILTALEEIPSEESSETIRRIKEQIMPDLIHCKDCVWFAPVESMPEAEKWHKKLHEIFDGIFPKREGKCGVCRKVTVCEDKPILTRPNGYCHRAERKEIE